MRTPTKKRKTPIKETKSVSVSTTSTPVKTSPKARRNLKLSDVEEEDVAMLKGEKGKKNAKEENDCPAGESTRGEGWEHENDA